jgi:hypothetical protein
MCRWLWKLFVWSRLLYRASRLDLSLQPNHPDRAAGLAFVGLVHGAFAPLVFAAMCGSAGTLATVVMAGEVELAGLRWVMIGLLVVMLLIVIGPLFVFMPTSSISSARDNSNTVHSHHATRSSSTGNGSRAERLPTNR